MRDEPELPANDLEERIKTQINRYHVALLLLRQNKTDWMNTVLEDAAFGSQEILELYCIKES